MSLVACSFRGYHRKFRASRTLFKRLLEVVDKASIHRQSLPDRCSDVKHPKSIERLMAEMVIGVAASGITIGALAAQIAIGMVKLKSYWDRVQDAPEEIRDLLEELEIYAQLLADVEDDQQWNPVSTLILDPTSKSRCAQYSKKGADQLKELADKLATDIEARSKLQRNWASAKVVLQRDKIQRYKTKIERAIRLLSFSHQLYTRWAAIFTYIMTLTAAACLYMVENSR